MSVLRINIFTSVFFNGRAIKLHKRLYKIYIESLNTKQNSIIDLDFIKEKNNASEQGYYFFEEKQQTTFKCDKCGLETNILEYMRIALFAEKEIR